MKLTDGLQTPFLLTQVNVADTGIHQEGSEDNGCT
jgi:hypothetical protein